MSQSGALTNSGSGAAVVETITGNSGGPVGPDAAFNIDLVGNTTMGITVVGNPGLNTLTIVPSQATTTQFGVVKLATNAQAIAGTDTANALTSDDLRVKLGTQTNHGLPIGAGTSSALTWTAAPANGEILIGNGGNDPVLNTITAGLGITVTNGPGTITISSNGGSTGSGTTVGAVTSDILTLSLGVAARTVVYKAFVSAFDSVTPSGAGYEILAVIRTTGAAATLIGTNVRNVIEDNTLLNADADIVISGNNAIVRVTGVAGLTINWTTNVIVQVGAP